MSVSLCGSLHSENVIIIVNQFLRICTLAGQFLKDELTREKDKLPDSWYEPEDL